MRVGNAFNAVGQFRLAPNGEAWATEAAAGLEPKFYTSVRHFSNVAAASPVQTPIPLGGLKGKDDIDVFRTEDGARADTLYAITETTQGTKFLLAFRGTFSGDRPERFDQMLDLLCGCEHLVLDDLGRERPTEWAQETLYLLVNAR